MSERKPPDFVIVGAVKCGTTSVHEYLDEHPSVFMSSPKETNFFSFLAVGRRNAYDWSNVAWDATARIESAEQFCALFAGARPDQLCGESSPGYVLEPRVPAVLREWNPGVRVVMVFRDPAERAWSDFLHHLRDGTEPLPLERFTEAFADSNRRIADNWAMHCVYEIKGCYGTQLAHWLTIFPREQIGVFFYDDLRRDPRAFMRSLYAFIGVDPSFEPDTGQHYNVTGVPRSRWLHRLVYMPHPAKRLFRWLLPPAVRRRLRYRLMQRNLQAPPALPDDIRRQLARHYLPEVEKLEALTGRDLSAWKPGTGA